MDKNILRLIRSKGVGVFFITQSPKDINEDILAQLGHRVQCGIMGALLGTGRRSSRW
jgi:DNA helicase HerA-like ATPase